MGGGGGVVFFFNDTATTEIYTLSLHDALPIFFVPVIIPSNIIWLTCRGTKSNAATINRGVRSCLFQICNKGIAAINPSAVDRKSTRLNSSHKPISYAVFCLKKKKHIKNRF